VRCSRPQAGDKSVDAKAAKKGMKGRKGNQHEKPNLLLLFFASFFSLCVPLKGVLKGNLCVERTNGRP
jgi:hypothetical protein